jgi:hypothetical protein
MGMRAVQTVRNLPFTIANARNFAQKSKALESVNP